MSLATVNESAGMVIDREAVLRHLNLDPRKPDTHALMLVCERYGLDPVLKHMVLIKGNPYVTRDGYLHVAHASGQFDGLEVVDTGKDDTHWWAKVSVYRKDMTRPITMIGRYPLDGDNRKYGPEMAVKTAEVACLRRAFDVGGIGSSDEQWDAVDVNEVSNVDADLIVRFRALPEEAQAKITAWARRMAGIDDLIITELPESWDVPLGEAIETHELRVANAASGGAGASTGDGEGVGVADSSTPAAPAADEGPVVEHASGAIANANRDTGEVLDVAEAPSFVAMSKLQNSKLHAVAQKVWPADEGEHYDAYDERIGATIRNMAAELGGVPIESRTAISKDLAGRMIDHLERIESGEVAA